MGKTLLPQGASSTGCVLQLPCPEAEARAPSTTPNGAHSATTESVCCTPPETGGSSKASTTDLTLAVNSNLDYVLTYLPMTLLSMS